ncbi:MAG: LON peptidase substrate-binding domain-containing protein [Chromatiaceae bacterium]|jgi:Lon protease-like protein|nr:LON peptidase substrate-binding domain-containing protein [Chromatiaceae bacterium]
MPSPFMPKFADLPTELPVFPLAGAVAMPGIQLPLNIYEPQYLNMIQDVLATDHLIGMIQPLIGQEDVEVPALHRVGCAGRVTSYSETQDGRVVIVLTGVCRFEVQGELEETRGYRRVRAAWSRFAHDFQPETGHLVNRERFLVSLRSYVRPRGVEIPWDDLKAMEDLDLINLLTAHLPLPSEDKQALIETINLVDRAELMRGLMDMASASSVEGVEQRH